jgi:regulator of sirC expression with transglutaminase-like and TPR domain
METYPNSRFAEDAKKAMAPFVFAGLTSSSDPADFEAFLERFPEGPTSDRARMRLEELRLQAQ